MYMKNFGEFFNNQIESAGTIVLSRTDVADIEKVEKAVELIREKNQKAAIVTTPISQLTGAELMAIIEKPTDDMAAELLEEVKHHHHHDHEEGECCCGHDHHDHDHDHHHHDHEEGECCCGHDHHDHDHHHDHEEGECCCGHDHHDHDHHHHHDHEEGECCCGHDHHDHDHHHHHHADEVFTSWGLETGRSVDIKKLEEILDDLAHSEKYGQVLRAKGMLPDKEGIWHYFDLVPDEIEIREGAPIYTGKVCVIGSNLKEDELKEIFK